MQDLFNVTSADGSATQQVTVDIRGANDGKKVLVLTDPSIVDASGGSDAEATNLVAAISSFGTAGGILSVSTVATTNTTVLQTALTGQDVFVIPEMERGTWWVSPEQEQVLENFVNNGGNLIINGFNGNQAHFLNTVFEWNASDAYDGSVASFKTPEGSGIFPSTPVTLPSNNGTEGLNGLPVDANVVYRNDSAVTVATWAYGAGTVGYLGWDWYGAAPVGWQDNGWNAVLNAAILL